MTVQSASKTGTKIETVYRAASSVNQLTSVTAILNISRQNDCDGQSCSKVCVLTPSSFRFMK